MGRMTTQARNGAGVYGDDDESYFRISWRVLHKNSQVDLRGGALPPYSIWEKPFEEDTFYPSTVGKDHKTCQSHVRPIKTATILSLETIHNTPQIRTI